MEIIDNFLPYEIFTSIQSMFYRSDFPWFWNDVKVNLDDDLLMCDYQENYQLFHNFFYNNRTTSDWNVYPIIDKLKVNALVRVKANLNVGTKTLIRYGYHTDNDLNCNTAIYYINTNNGFTEFIDGKRVESVENRILIFNSNLKHTGTNCTDKKRRIVLNINYF